MLSLKMFGAFGAFDTVGAKFIRENLINNC